MKLALILATLTACVFPTQAKPLKIFILAGQSNMEGPASIKTFDYIGDDPAPAAMPEFKGSVFAVQTAPFWSDELGAIDQKHEKVRQMRWFLDAKHKDHANADGKMTEEKKRAFVKKFEADLITPAEVALWKRGASNAGYHYLGCAKTFALMGKALAEANLHMLAEQKSR